MEKNTKDRVLFCNRLRVRSLYMGVSAYRKRIIMNQSYFERVYEKTYRSLLKYAIVHLSDPTDAEDALQNVYVDFYRRIQRYGHFDILSPEAFLTKMLKREIIRNYKQREQRRIHLLEQTDEERLPEGEPFEDAVMDRALAEQILSKEKQLPKELYRAFVLYYGYELSVAQIATTLGVGREAVKSRLFRARNQLRASLQESGEIGGNQHE